MRRLPRTAQEKSVSGFLIEQKIRTCLFYLSVLIFFSGLPFILSFSLGYKFDRRTFKFTKAGLIFLKTQPQGADVYLNGKLLDEKTPVALRELLPGSYSIRLELEKHYPWVGEVKVAAARVTLIDKIILFPLRPNIKQINKEKFDLCWIEEEKGAVYYINYEDNSVWRSDLDGLHYEKIASFLGLKPLPSKWKVSPDKEKFLYFNKHQLGIAYLELSREETPVKPPFILDYSAGAIIDVFWHSDNYHLIVVSDRNIEVLEAKPQSVPIELAKITKRDILAFYNLHEDALYFTDSQKAADGVTYNNLYKLELSIKTFLFNGLMKLNPKE